jgi:hypothetical protein
MASISVRKLAVLALLDAPDDRGRHAPIVGVTRLQKLLFLTWTELPRVAPTRGIRMDIAFRPEKFGPADFDLYPDLEFLTALGHIERRVAGSPDDSGQNSALTDRSDIADATERELSYEYLMGDETVASSLALAESTEDEYQITPIGQELLRRLGEDADQAGRQLYSRVISIADAVRKRYGSWPLQRLLRYVYTEYPEMTTASEIRERVMGKY